jgi:hypothetical protein
VPGSERERTDDRPANRHLRIEYLTFESIVPLTDGTVPRAWASVPGATPNRERIRVFEDKTAEAVRACQVVMYEVTPIYGGAVLPVHDLDMIAVGNAGFLLVDTIPNQK